MTTKTQTRAPARALVGAAMFGSALALVLVAAHGVEQDPATTSDARLSEAGLRGPINVAEAPAPQAEPQLVKASILPEIPAALRTPVPGLAFRTPKFKASERDIECLTRAVYFESRGDTDVGQAAVAQVVLNRSRHPAFPKSVCAVVNQGVERRSCQFSFVCKPTKVTDPREWRRAREVAEKAIDGHTVPAVGTSTFFHAARINPGWRNLSRVGQFGAHVFYKYPGKKGAESTFAAAPKPSLLDQFTGPLQVALSKPAVQTVNDPGEPILGLPKGPQPYAKVMQTAAAAPATVPTVKPVQAPEDRALKVDAAPLQVPAPAAEPAPAKPLLQPISTTPAMPAPPTSSAS